MGEVASAPADNQSARRIVGEALREAAERLGAALRERGVPREQARAARGLLQEVWAWEQDPAASAHGGIALEGRLAAALDGAPATAALSARIGGRLLGRWPLKLRCLSPPPMTLMLDGAEALGQRRAERTEAFLACFGVSPDKLPLTDRAQVAYRSAQEYFAFGVVEKRGRG